MKNRIESICSSIKLGSLNSNSSHMHADAGVALKTKRDNSEIRDSSVMAFVWKDSGEFGLFPWLRICIFIRVKLIYWNEIEKTELVLWFGQLKLSLNPSGVNDVILKFFQIDFYPVDNRHIFRIYWMSSENFKKKYTWYDCGISQENVQLQWIQKHC